MVLVRSSSALDMGGSYVIGEAVMPYGLFRSFVFTAATVEAIRLTKGGPGGHQ